MTPDEEIEALARDLYDLNPARSSQYATQEYPFDSPMAGEKTEAAKRLARTLHGRGWRQLGL